MGQYRRVRTVANALFRPAVQVEYKRMFTLFVSLKLPFCWRALKFDHLVNIGCASTPFKRIIQKYT